MRRILLTLILAFCSQGHAALDSAPLQPIFARLAEVMPVQFAKGWKAVYPKLTISIKDDVPGCTRYYSRSNSNPKGQRTSTSYYLQISSSCVSHMESLNPSFTTYDVLKNPFLKGLFKISAYMWSKTSAGKFIFSKKMKRQVYANHYYFTPLTIGVNIYGSVKESLLNFWTESILAYMTDPIFVQRHPDVYKLVAERVFHGAEFFPKMYSDADLQKTSDDLYPTRAKLKFMPTAADAWFMRYHLIKSAKRTIYVQYFILEDDIFGQTFVALLIQAMKERGVKVKVMLDGRGSLITSRGRLMRALRANGAEAVSYNPMLLGIRNLFKFFTVGPISAFVAANHDKLLLVDETKMITGGRNIGTEYFVKAEESDKKVFKDADVYAEFEQPFIPGIAAFNTEFYSEHTFDVRTANVVDDGVATTKDCMASLEAMEDRFFNENLSEETLRTHPELARYKSIGQFAKFDPAPSKEYYRIKSLDKTSRLLDANNFSEEIFTLIRESHRIVIQNPYIALTKNMTQALIDSCAKPNTRIIFNTTTNKTNDNAAVQAKFNREWKKILRTMPCSEIYGVTGPEQLHAKLFVFDRNKVIVGGYNMDRLSEKFNSEFGLLVDSPEFATMAEDTITETIAKESVKFDLAKNIGPYTIADSNASRLRDNVYYFINFIIGSYL